MKVPILGRFLFAYNFNEKTNEEIITYHKSMGKLFIVLCIISFYDVYTSYVNETDTEFALAIISSVFFVVHSVSFYRTFYIFKSPTFNSVQEIFFSMIIGALFNIGRFIYECINHFSPWLLFAFISFFIQGCNGYICFQYLKRLKNEMLNQNLIDSNANN